MRNFDRLKKELQDASLEEVAEFLFNCGACPIDLCPPGASIDCNSECVKRWLESEEDKEDEE